MLSRTLAVVAIGSLASRAHAQYVETEPNNNKSQANVFQLADGEFFTATTDAGTDWFLVSATPRPFGIYRHRLALERVTGISTTGRTCGLRVTGGAIEVPLVHSELTSGTFADGVRVYDWYGAGRGEQWYFKNPTIGTNIYRCTVSSVPVTPIDVDADPSTPASIEPFTAGTLDLSAISLAVPPSNFNGGQSDVSLAVFDSGLRAIPNYWNDDCATGGWGACLQRSFGPGVYYVTAHRQVFTSLLPAPDDRQQNTQVLDFPGAVVASESVAPFRLSFTDYPGGSPRTSSLDGFAASMQLTWYRINVASPCTPPSVTEDPLAANACETHEVQLHAAASGTAPLSYQWKRDGSPIAGATSADYFIASASAADAGLYTVVVSNACGAATSQPAQVQVHPNGPEIHSQPEDVLLCIGTTATFSVEAHDHMGNALTYQWRKDGADIPSANAPTLQLTVASAADQGLYDCVVTEAECGSAESLDARLTVRLEAPAIVRDGPDVVMLRRCQGTVEPYVELGAHATDDCDATVAVTASGQVGSEPGVYTITYSASDSQGNAAAPVTRSVFVIESTPIAEAGADASVLEGGSVTLDGSLSRDPDGGSLSYAWTQIGGNSVALDLGDPARPTFVAPAVPAGGATLTFQLVVSDGYCSSEPDIANVTVVNVNNPPVALAGDDQAVAEGSPVALDGSSSYDVDGEELAYSWIQIGGAPVALGGADSVRPTFVAPWVGPSGMLLTFLLAASDGIDTDFDVVDVLVENVNHDPLAAAGSDQTRAEGALVSLDASASSDPDADLLSFAWTQIGGPSVVLSDPAAAAPSFTAPQVGAVGATLVFRLTVTDGYGGMDDDEVVVTVQDVASPPSCGLARASVAEIWPPNHKLVPISIVGVTDPGNSEVQITILNVTQDEPINGLGDGDTGPDAIVQGDRVLLRAERSGTGNGRVYRVHFRADNASGGSCTGSVLVCVPHSKGKSAAPCVDDGQTYVSTGP